MDKYNAIQKAKYIEDRYSNYLRSIFKFGDEKMQSIYENLLKREELFKGPYVNLEMPFVRGKNINNLIEEGVICPDFHKLANVDFTRPLYAHQEKAIRHIGQGKGAIITTGTGSGKTESFLYPILNDILKDIHNGNAAYGVRAMFLYPMNALINDQIDRVRSVLSNCPEITFGFFTGDTKEMVSSAERRRIEKENQIKIPFNELISREAMRETPPHILFTNYSMLEYMLIRPDDDKIFAMENLQNWKYIVLDEAHTYCGAQGIEMSFLLRRVTAFAPSKPRFILTSATLGQQGKSENKIIEFAKKLTGMEFFIDDIVFADRYSFSESNSKYAVDGHDYTCLLNSVKRHNFDADLLEKYHIENKENIKYALYNLLIHDRNTYKLYDILHNGAKEFKVILQEYEGAINEEELVSLIELVNYAEDKNGRGIFDLKYHSFVRPLSGAYMSMEKQRKLTLYTTSSIGDYKAFEVGNCNYCGVLYLIGKIKYDNAKKLDILLHNQEVDIYENYGENKLVQLDYFLLNDNVDDEANKEMLEEYSICSKCGACKPVDVVNRQMCDCGQAFHFQAYRVNRKKTDSLSSEAYNNLNICPICGQQHNDGVVKSFNLGKDKGTAAIAQFLFESLAENIEVQPKRQREKFSLFAPKKKNTSEEKVEKIKQFLTFSDSRQQASFSAVYFDAIMQKSLHRRLIWKIIEDNKYEDMPFDLLLARLRDFIKNNDLLSYDDGEKNFDAEKTAWIALLGDLLKRDGQWDSEGLGLYFFDLDISKVLQELEDDEKELERCYNLDLHSFENLVQVVLEIFKIAPAIEYTDSKLMGDEKIKYLEYKGYEKYIKYQSDKTETNIRSFMPIKRELGNRIVRYVQKACNLDYVKTVNLLDLIFNTLLLDWCKESVQMKSNDGLCKIRASSYIIKNYKKHKYYQCQKCHRLTPYNVNNVCVKDRCTGKLKEINPDDILKDNFYRNEYKNKKIEKIVIREHTAQLDNKQAKTYQNEFKNKKINILSCSTTFEMGIDLGDLDTVYMRNVPPSPANYVQRAGRAGRRKDKSAYVLTYCGIGSHDFTYFVDPEKMISGVIEPPYFDIDNKKIMERHLFASGLGFFFKKYRDYFNTDKMFFGSGETEFMRYMQECPKALKQYIDERVIPEREFQEVHNFKWYDKENSKLQICTNDLKSMIKEYEHLEKEASDNKEYNQAKQYKNQIDIVKNSKLLDILSSHGVIPKYGFPVDVVNLDVYENGLKNNKLDLNRDLKIAISEYAPESEIIVNGKKYTSRYISMPYAHDVHDLPRYSYAECPKCRRKNVMLGEGYGGRKCKYCGQDISDEKTQEFVVPVNGFKTGDNKNSTRKKPRKTYAGEVSYLGDGKENNIESKLSDDICVLTSSDDKLMIMNRAKFLMCPVCGYAKKSKSASVIKHHLNYHKRNCMCTELKRIQIGYVFKTDVTRFSIKFLDIAGEESEEKALSFLYAFLEGMSIALSINRRDIEGVVEPNYEQKIFDVLIYDSVPGGAGYVKKLLDKNSVIESLEAALHKIEQKCCDENTSCYNCLRNYYNQKFHNKLKRKYAREILKEVLISLKA